MQLKICGMKYNTKAVAALSPDYLGFIFYEKSPRNFSDALPKLPPSIKKVGVFVDATPAFAKAKTAQFELDILQLHGDESPAYLSALKKEVKAKLWKVFSVGQDFDYAQLGPYEGLADAFLFDTKGAYKGGNGYTFDWSILENYPSQTPFVLSGGIGLSETTALKALQKQDLPLLAIDVNSRFEIRPGQKNIEQLKKLQQQLR
tara:strand:- start:242 stop:850 length:609 start_codon:yes stop_codon:yes gene_type:complete